MLLQKLRTFLLLLHKTYLRVLLLVLRGRIGKKICTIIKPIIARIPLLPSPSISSLKFSLPSSVEILLNIGKSCIVKKIIINTKSTSIATLIIFALLSFINFTILYIYFTLIFSILYIIA